MSLTAALQEGLLQLFARQTRTCSTEVSDTIRKCIINTMSQCKIVTIPVVTNVLALLTPKSVPARKEATQTVRSAILEEDYGENTVAERSKTRRRT